jgi:hypothetical protein
MSQRKSIIIALVVGIGLAVGGQLLWADAHRDGAVTVAYYEESQILLAGPTNGPAPTTTGTPAITVWVDGGDAQTFSYWDVQEEPNQIVVTVREPPHGVQDLVLVHYGMTWPLSRPVGTRQVIDGSTGKVVPLKASSTAR